MFSSSCTYLHIPGVYKTPTIQLHCILEHCSLLSYLSLPFLFLQGAGDDTNRTRVHGPVAFPCRAGEHTNGSSDARPQCSVAGIRCRNFNTIVQLCGASAARQLHHHPAFMRRPPPHRLHPEMKVTGTHVFWICTNNQQQQQQHISIQYTDVDVYVSSH